MAERPVVLLTFANQQDAYLANLKEESRKLNDLLSAQHDKQAIEVYREESATVDTIAKAFQRFSKRIVLFHYAGHADGQRLHLEDQGGDAAGIADQLALLPNLQLVFLNGCSTYAQVERLLSLGIKAVIATAVPISDTKAVEFAEQFYGALAQNNTINDSFLFAVGALRTRYGGTFNATIVRRGELAAFANTEKMPWGLFVNTDADAILQWSMPTIFTTQVTRPPDVKYEPNSLMVDILDAMIGYNPKLEPLLTTPDGERIDDREALSLIIEHLPWPIGVQIRLMAIRDGVIDTASVERIRQVASTYIVLVQYLFYIAMSQLWDARRGNPFPIYGYLADLFHFDARRYNHFDYFKAFIDTIRALKSNGQSLFVSEFDALEKTFSDVSGEVYSSYLYLESLRSKLNNRADAELEANKFQLCADGEYFLSTLLIHTAFLVKYDLITIRDIYVVNPKHLPTRFNHYIGRLNAKVTDIAVGRAPRARTFDMYAHNASVVLTTDAQNLSRFLNLSPFIIDKNAFGVGMTEERATEQQLYMYGHREGEEYKYFATQHNIYRVQERPTDQLLTNQGGEEVPDPNRRSRVSRVTRNAEEAPPSPYAVLKEQFKLLENDLMG